MSLDDAAALAEIIGALGVIISIVYLAVQIRQNTLQLQDTAKDARLDSFDRSIEAFARFRTLLAQADNAALYEKGLNDYLNLDAAEKHRFGAIIDEYFFAFHGIFGRVVEGRYPAELWDRQAQGVSKVIQRPGGAQWWEVRKFVFSEGFRERMEKIRDS